MLNLTVLDNTVTDANNQTAYQRFRFDLISTLEAIHRPPYLDSKGIPTIGIGFNLRDDDILELVLRKFGMDAPKGSALLAKFHDIVKQSYSNNAALQAALDAEMTKQHNANPAIRSTFAFSGGDVGLMEMRAVFDTAVKIYDNPDPLKPGRVDNWLSGIPDSYERAVLVSMSYNGYINAGNYSSSLRNAIVSGDRAEAWFQIRYDSNRLAKHYLTGTLTAAETAANGAFTNGEDRGVAKRHFVEADVFGLYQDSNNVTLAEAKQTYQMLQKHREYILKYEAGYGQTPEGLAGTRGNMIAAANNNLAIVTNIVGVSSLLESFDPACTVILDDLAASTDPSLKAAYDAWAANNRAGFVSTDLYFGSSFSGALDATLNESATGSNDVLMVDDTAPVRNWILKGGKGDDLLIGGAGDDQLYGGDGHDYLAGGGGDDKYYVKTGEQVLIEDKSGINTILLDGKALASFYRLAGGTYVSYDGSLTGELTNGEFIVYDNNGTRITLNKNFASGDFGITLSDTTQAPTQTTTITGDILPDDIDPAKAGIQAAADANGNPIGQAGVYADILTGTAGNDHILSGELADDVGGGAGDDRIEGGNGSDYLHGGAGDDDILGDSDYLATSFNWTVTNSNGTRLFSPVVEQAAVGPSAGSGQAQADVIYAGNGNDYVWAGQGNDVVFGEGGDDKLSGNDGNDILIGGAARMRLRSGLNEKTAANDEATNAWRAA